jgi:hypothetical protein
VSDAKTNALKTRWWVDNNSIAIVRENSGSTDPQYLSPNEVKSVTAFCIVEDENFVTGTGTGIRPTEVPAIPEEFQEALVDFAMCKAYETKPDGLQNASYFKMKFDKAVVEGKRYANQANDGSSYNIKQYDY